MLFQSQPGARSLDSPHVVLEQSRGTFIRLTSCCFKASQLIDENVAMCFPFVVWKSERMLCAGMHTMANCEKDILQITANKSAFRLL